MSEGSSGERLHRPGKLQSACWRIKSKTSPETLQLVTRRDCIVPAIESKLIWTDTLTLRRCMRYSHEKKPVTDAGTELVGSQLPTTTARTQEVAHPKKCQGGPLLAPASSCHLLSLLPLHTLLACSPAASAIGYLRLQCH